MPSMQALVRRMRELDDRLRLCRRCGRCQSVCPVFEQTGREADVARGKLALLSALTASMVDDPAGVYRRLTKCLLCGACAVDCPAGVGVQEIFLRARAALVAYMGLHPVNHLVLRRFLAEPDRCDRWSGWGARFQNWFAGPAAGRVGATCTRMMSPMIQSRPWPTLAPVPFHRQVPPIDRPKGRSGIRAAIFTGCLIDKVYPAIAHSVLKVLKHHAVGIYLPERQGCCGMPALAAGDLTAFDQLLVHNLQCFEAGRFDVLVTACATCAATIHELWPTMADARRRDAALVLAGRSMDIHRFLVREVGLAPLAAAAAHPRSVTYHDPCHLKKSLKVFEEPRAVIQAVPGCKLTEMVSSDRCCGMGGAFGFQHAEIAVRIGSGKAARIQDTGAGVVATGCPACMIQLSNMLSRAGAGVAVRHPIDLYAEALGA